MEIALQQFEAMAESGEEISRIARETGLNITSVEELMARANFGHLQVLAEVYDKVPEQAKQAIERTMADLMICHEERVQALRLLQLQIYSQDSYESGWRIEYGNNKWNGVFPDDVPQGQGQTCLACRR